MAWSQYPISFPAQRLRRNQFRGKTENATAQKTAPGRNPSRSGLSVGGEVRIPIRSATHAQDRAAPIAIGARRRRLRASKLSKPSPTNHQAGRQKNGIVMVCHVRIDNAVGCWRRYEAAGTERGAPTSKPGRLRSVIRWNRRSPTAVSDRASQWSGSCINSICPDRTVAFPDLWTALSRAYMKSVGISTTADQTARSAIGSRRVHDTVRGFK